MSNTLNKKILYGHVPGQLFDDLARYALKLNYPMFCHNDDVYSTKHAIDLIGEGKEYIEVHKRSRLFNIKEL